jgi:hypothetical protein
MTPSSRDGLAITRLAGECVARPPVQREAALASAVHADRTPLYVPHQCANTAGLTGKRAGRDLDRDRRAGT